MSFLQGRRDDLSGETAWAVSVRREERKCPDSDNKQLRMVRKREDVKPRWVIKDMLVNVC